MKTSIYKRSSFYFSILLSTHAYTTQNFQDSNDKAAYEKGLQHRNAGDTQKAMDCFLSLAEKGHAKAQHNLAMGYWKLSEDKSIDIDRSRQQQRQAYTWFKRASDAGFEPSRRNLEKMDLISLLLPQDILGEIASHLSMYDALQCMRISKKFHGGIQDLILRTDYYHSNAPFSQHIKDLFKGVTFEPKPDAILLSRFIKSDTSAIEVHFRDTKHLRQIIERTSMADGKGSSSDLSYDDMYFVLNEKIKDGHEFVSSDTNLETGYFFDIVANACPILKGQIKTPCNVVLPKGSDLNAVAFSGKCYSQGQIKLLKDARDLANSLDNFKSNILDMRTLDAQILLKSQIKSRLADPERYPNFSQLCPNAQLLSLSEIRIKQQDYIHAEPPFIYTASSCNELRELRMRFPDFKDAISYINKNLTQAGIYSLNPLSIIKGFEIKTDQYLIALGLIHLPNYNIFISAKTGVSMLGTKFRTLSARIYSEGDFNLLGLDNFVYTHQKPKYMPQADWENFLRVGSLSGLFQTDFRIN